MTNLRNLLTIVAAFALAGLTSITTAAPPTNLELSSSVDNVVSDYAPSTNFTIRVFVSANDTATTPAHAALRFTYDPADVSYVAASGMAADGWLGTIDGMAVGAEEATTGTLVTRDIPTLGNFANTDLTPDIMEVSFQVSASPTYPIDITFGLDPGASMGANSFLDTNASPLTVTAFDFSATQGLMPISTVEDWIILNE